MYKVFIDGKEGTTGLRILERFEKRSDIKLMQIDDALRKDPAERAKYINDSDITFLCLPDAAARESVSLCQNPHVRIIDASTAHRTNPDWAYGFAELGKEFREKIATSNRVAVPGCHAGGFISLAYPMVKSGFLPADYPISCFSLTGYSGGGKKMIAEYTSPDRSPAFDSPRQYGVNQSHKHLPEMQYIPGLTNQPVFIPVVCDFYSGMQVSLPVYPQLLPGKPTLKDIHDMFCKAYEGQKMIKVRPILTEGLLPSNGMSGRDDMEIYIAGNDQRAVLISQFDNLGKGASGAAIQCLNIMLGLDDGYTLNIGD